MSIVDVFQNVAILLLCVAVWMLGNETIQVSKDSMKVLDHCAEVLDIARDLLAELKAARKSPSVSVSLSDVPLPLWWSDAVVGDDEDDDAR